MNSASITITPVVGGNLGNMSSIAAASLRDHNEKVELKWKNINYQTLIKDPQASKFMKSVYKVKNMLVDVSGTAHAGQLLAIIGPTGCGKTSLLNVLAARVPNGGDSYNKLSGTIYVNGRIRQESKFRRISAYVLQDDNMFPHLTVLETLTLAAQFYLPTTFSFQQKDDIVNSTIAELGLVKAKSTIIGDDTLRGVSGGERKRTSIAVQLLTDPVVLFLDEPTSGLDAFQSQAVMEAMKNLASNGRLVIAVIHQPRSSIFDMFDQLLVLSDGRVMFYGNASESVQYFGKLGHLCPDVFNPPDYFLDLLSPDNRSVASMVETSNRIRYIGDAWVEYSNSLKKVISIDDNIYSHDNGNMDNNDDNKELQNTTTSDLLTYKKVYDIPQIFRTFSLLLWRSWTETTRATGTIIAKFVGNIIFAVIIGGVYSNLKHDQTSINNRIGILFFILINQSFGAVTGVLSTFPREKNIVAVERTQDAYPVWIYFIAKVLVELPFILLPVIVYDIVIYPIMKLHSGVNYLYFTLISLLVVCSATGLGFAISSVAPNGETANALGVPVMIIFILFGGFYIAVDQLPIVANWIPYICIFRWGYEALMINEFKGLKFECNKDDAYRNCFRTGEAVLANQGFGDLSINTAVMGLGLLTIGFFSLAFVLLLSSRISYTRLGHQGHSYMKYKPVSSVDITTITTTGHNNTTTTKSGTSYELVDENDMVHA